MKVRAKILSKRLYAKLCLSAVVLLLTIPVLRAQGPSLTHLSDSITEVSVAPAVGPPNPHRAFISRRTLKTEEQAASMDFEVALKMRNFAELQQRVASGEHISLQELAAKYEPLPSDYKAVADWITSQGFKITRQSSNHLAIFASGKVSRVAQAMQVTFARVTLRGNEYTSAITAPSVPSTLAPLLIGVNGLQPHIRMHKHSMKPAAANGAAPYSPSQIAQAYQASGLYNTGITGAGQTIAIVIDTFPLQGDLISFWDSYGINQSINNVQFIQAVQGTLAATTGEETLDTEWSSSIAPGAKVRVYAATDLGSADLDQAYQQVYDDVTGSLQLPIHQMSMSYGIGEIEATGPQLDADDYYFVELANAGVTIFASSGDEGATPGDNPYTLEVESPASDPYVIGVGGTTLKLDSNNNESSEVVWNDGASGGATGGGASQHFARPSWQTGTGVGSGTHRLVPDISCAADPNYGAGYYYTVPGPGGGVETTSGGTSWSSPTCAAFCALINQARANLGLPAIGQSGSLKMGPLIYPLIGTTNFRDIVTGNNVTTAGGYTAGTGYDEASGIGVPLVQTMAKTLAGTQTLVGVSQQPAFQTVNQTQNATFTATATGSPVGYQWQRMPVGTTTWSNISDSNNGVYSGFTAASLTVTNATTAMSGDQFQCVVTYSGTPALTGAPPSVLVVETPWIITTLAGQTGTTGLANGTGTGAQFNYPTGIAVDSSGNLYIADLYNNVIRKVTSAGVVTTPYGNLQGTAGNTDGTGNDGSGNSAHFYYPRDIAVDIPNNLLYVSDEGSNQIRKINMSSGQVSTIGNPASSPFSEPKGIAVDSSGTVYVADYSNNVIRKITTGGTISILAGSSAYAAGYADGAATTQALFNNPIGLAVDSSKNVYVTDYGNEVVRKINTTTGQVSTVAGQAGVAGCLDGPGSQALFNVPRGIMVDSFGNLYVTDSFASSVTSPPELSGNSLLRKITPTGVVSTLAGQAGAAGSADGTGNVAQFYNSCGVAMNSATGNIYVADAGNNTIRAGTLPAIPATITVSASPTNGGTVTGGGTFNVGTSQTVVAAANSGYTFSKWTQNGSVVSTSASYTFTVTASAALVANFVAPPAFTNVTSATFALGQPWSFYFTATGYPAPTFSLTSGSLPPGLTLSLAGVLSGTPTQSGTFIGTITAINGVSPNATQVFTSNVQAAVAFSDWENSKGLTGNSTVTGPTATPENDGVPNLLKYLYNVDPVGPMTAADYAVLPVADMTTIGGTQYLTLTFRQYALKTGITINVQTSFDLQTWTTVATEPSPSIVPIGNDPNISTGDPIMQARVPFNVTATKEFIRLNVTQP
jgi:kumamolisin